MKGIAKAQGKGIVAWSCGGIGGKPRFTALPACREDQALELRVHFRLLERQGTRQSGSQAACGVFVRRRLPGLAPVPVPMLAVVLPYPTVPARAQLASGRVGGHADFMNGWEPDAFARLVTGLNYG